MALENLERYAEKLHQEYIRTGAFEYLNSLVLFYETLKESKRLKGQTEIAKRLIFKCNPKFAEGYFKIIKHVSRQLDSGN